MNHEINFNTDNAKLRRAQGAKETWRKLWQSKSFIEKLTSASSTANSQIIQCTNCGLIGGGGVMRQKHNNNCTYAKDSRLGEITDNARRKINEYTIL